jgi:hypothetical protein
MPATEYHRQAGTIALYHTADFDGVEDHRPSQQRYAEATAITDLASDCSPIVSVERAINDSWFKARFAQRSGQTEEPKWRTKNRSGIRRQEQNNLARTTHGIIAGAGLGPLLPKGFQNRDSFASNLFPPVNETTDYPNRVQYSNSMRTPIYIWESGGDSEGITRHSWAATTCRLSRK